MSEEQTSIENRLRDTSNTCLTCFETWQKDKENSAASEALHSAVHELRKVASRLEIELAISERDNNTQRPIQPPVHKTSRANRDQDGDKQGGQKRQQRRSRKPTTPKTDNAA